MDVKRVCLEFGLSIVLICSVVLLYFIVPDKDFAISSFFFILLIFIVCINDFSVTVNGQRLITANFIPLYTWILWFMFIHDRYNNSEEGSLGPWIKSILMFSLLPISHIPAVKSSLLANSTLFVVTCVVFVMPVYVQKITMELSVRDIVWSGFLLLFKTVMYLMVYIASSVYNSIQSQKNVVCINNSLWVLGSTAWLLPAAFLQIGTYLLLHSREQSETILPTTVIPPEPSSSRQSYVHQSNLPPLQVVRHSKRRQKVAAEEALRDFEESLKSN